MRSRHSGAALLAAMLTVTLVATFAAAALWQQWRAVEIESADRQRVQSAWILTGALDWARLILREDRGNVDHLGEPWAVPLQEARLSTFLAAGPNNQATSDGNDPDNVFLSGDITDLQGRLNLSNLADSSGQPRPRPLDNFRRLFEMLGLPQQQLATMAENLRFAFDISVDNRNTARAALPPQRVEQLVWLGVSAETAAALEPYVTVLPQGTAVNLNTASAEVIYAVGRNISLADAQRLVAQRQARHFTKKDDVTPLLPANADIEFSKDGFSVDSNYFEVRGRLRIDSVVIEERSVVHRNGQEVRAIQRERGAFERFGPDQAAAGAPTMPRIR
jgi:general secretion pathway protein K